MAASGLSYAPAVATNHRLAKMFAADMKLGIALQEEVGSWIAHLGSSASKPGCPTYQTAYKTGSLIVSQLRRAVGTGNSTGTMEAANRGAIEAGGISVGIYLDGLPTEQYRNPYTTHSITCHTLLARQHLLLSGASGVVVGAEGGWGTIFEIGHQLIEMRRKSFNPSCPIVIIDGDDLWQGFQRWMDDELVGRGLWSGTEYKKLIFVRSAEEAVDELGKRLPALS